MIRQILTSLLLTTLLAACTSTQPAAVDPPIRTLIITGHNNHDWPFTSQTHKETLEASGRFVVDITDSPSTALADASQLARYQLFVLDYNDMHEPKRWGEPAETNFINAVKAGTGVVAVHSANNAFKGWIEYERMLGLLWRDDAGHGRFHPFDVAIVDHEHPITRGLDDIKSHPDELYHRLTNPQGVDVHLLAKAFSSPDSNGTGRDEPMAFTLQYGLGRVFATPLGHVWPNEPATRASILDPQFQVLLCRGAEWATTGRVTIAARWQDVIALNAIR